MDSELIRELGDNYDRYHVILETKLAELGGRPQREKFARIADFLEAWDRAEAIVKAEELLRRCKRFRESGRSLDAPTDFGRPLVDREDRLVSAE